MTTQKVADKLVALCKENKFHKAIEELYSQNVVSVEAVPSPLDGSRQTGGLAGVKAKHTWWAESHEVHGVTVEGPLVAGPFFSAAFKFDVTFKPEHRRFIQEVVALYKVADGKVAYQELFFTT